MKPVTQTKLVATHNNGNCLAACLASIFEVGITDIPEFEEMPASDWFQELVDWLRSKGRKFHEIQAQEQTPKGIYIGVGQSPRNPKNTHAVVVKDGVMIHDPHPSGAGVKQMFSWWILEEIS